MESLSLTVLEIEGLINPGQYLKMYHSNGFHDIDVCYTLQKFDVTTKTTTTTITTTTTTKKKP